jgi:hypothetical protein
MTPETRARILRRGVVATLAVLVVLCALVSV